MSASADVPRRPLPGALMGAVLLLAGLFPVSFASPAPASAAPTELFFSEYIEGSSNNKALEIFNGTGAAVDLAAGGYNVQMYFNGNPAAGLTINLTGTVADGDVFVIAHSSAVAAILAQADQTNGSGWFNGDDAVVLRKGTTVIDAVGQVGFDPGSEWGTGLTSTADNTLRRKPTIEAGDLDHADVFNPALEWNGFATDTFDGLGTHTIVTPSSSPVINEFSASTTGTDVEYVEILGPPSTDLSALTVLELEGDSGSTPGTIDEVIGVGTTSAAGFYLANLTANTLENGTITLLLVRDFSGVLGNDLDTNDDGTLDVTPWSELVDSVAVNDGGSGDVTYGVPSLGPNYDGLSSFAPGGASRIPDGVDTGAASDWVRNDFDLAGIPGFTGSPVVGEALNTPGAPNELFVPPVTGNCGDAATLIHEIQGSGLASPLAGDEVFIEGIVVGDFQNNGQTDNGDLNGFHVQEEDADADADPDTSEGIFVFASGAGDVSLGDKVRVVGTVAEFNGLTELTGVGGVLVCSSGTALPSAASVTLPVSSLNDFERFEGMRVTFPQALVISEYFNFDRFGEIVLTVDRQHQPTAVHEPGSPEAAARALANTLGRITLDDGRTVQNPDPAIHPNGDVFDLTNRFRGGDTVEDVTGVMDFAFGRYRVHPTQGADYEAVNPRPEDPEDVGGSLKVASFNVLNYFTTIDNAGPICGPAANQGCRGADTPEEFERQRSKIVAALTTMGADVVGLIEIENHPADVPTADLVDGLNDALGAGTYEYIETGAIGGDAIRVALIYKPGTVSPVGDFAILDSSVDSRFDDTRSRPVLAQTFTETASGGVFTVAVNHLKSKGSACGGPPDDDPQQGNCNGTRTRAAEAMADWLAADPTGSGDRDVLIMGDLNAYDKEDPIDVLRAGVDDTAGTSDDYTDLILEYQGEFAYSFVFDGQLGYLDHALASPTMAAQVTGATEWHVNADEPDILDYDMTFKQDAQDALFEPNAFRSSDHDPVIVGLDLANLDLEFSPFAPPVGPGGETTAKAGSTVSIRFGLGGDQGFTPFFNVPHTYACDSGEERAPATAAGGSGFHYDPISDLYVFAWKTSRSWAESCRAIEFVLDDGTFQAAQVTFVR